MAGLRRHSGAPAYDVRLANSLAGASIAARLAGRTPADAVALGVAVASIVVQAPGAITPAGEVVLPAPRSGRA